MTLITHPVPVGTLTNIGTIRSYKYVRYGYGKYRYFVEEVDTDFREDEITEIIKKKKVNKCNKLHIELLDPTGVTFDKYTIKYPANDPESRKQFRTLLNFNDTDYYYIKENGKELEKINSSEDEAIVVPIQWITRQWIQKMIDAENLDSAIDHLSLELNHLAKMYKYEKNIIK